MLYRLQADGALDKKMRLKSLHTVEEEGPEVRRRPYTEAVNPEHALHNLTFVHALLGNFYVGRGPYQAPSASGGGR